MGNKLVHIHREAPWQCTNNTTTAIKGHFEDIIISGKKVVPAIRNLIMHANYSCGCHTSEFHFYGTT